MRSHNLEHKSSKRKRSFRKADPVAESNVDAVKRMLRLK
jgi:ribosomal protein L35